MNQLASQLMGQQLSNSPIAQAYQLIQAASNTDVALKQQLANLPNGKVLLELLEKYNGNYEQAVKAYITSQGINLTDIVNLKKNMNI